VIGAHYDHIGMGGKYSRSIGKHAVHPGADDNASGVAIMLNLACYLPMMKYKFYNYYLVAFGAHEVGLFGSKYFVKSNIVDTANIALMINLDMVGRFDTVSKTFICESSYPGLPDSVVRIDSITPFKIKHRDMTMGDQTPFLEKHIPVLRFTTGMHDDYHTINDKAEKINYAGMDELYHYIHRLVEFLNRFGFPEKNN
jgi:Zn-dependent M28 family amino/carboxypeptidase